MVTQMRRAMTIFFWETITNSGAAWVQKTWLCWSSVAVLVFIRSSAPVLTWKKSYSRSSPRQIAKKPKRGVTEISLLTTGLLSFIHVVQTLEGKSEEEAKQREEELRSKISQVIPCDIRENNPIELKEPTLFDVVGSSLCLEAVMESEAAYREAILKLSKLLKPGGHLVMAGVLGQSFYRVGDGKFYTFPLSKDLIYQALEEGRISRSKSNI